MEVEEVEVGRLGRGSWGAGVWEGWNLRRWEGEGWRRYGGWLGRGWGVKVAGLGKEKVEGVEGVGGQGEWEVKEEEFITSRVVLMPPLKEAEVRVAGIPLLLNTQ